MSENDLEYDYLSDEDEEDELELEKKRVITYQAYQLEALNRKIYKTIFQATKFNSVFTQLRNVLIIVPLFIFLFWILSIGNYDHFLY